MMNRKVLSIFGLEPFRIGGAEAFARELSRQLGVHRWQSILCFETAPTERVRRFLSLPNVSLEVFERPSQRRWERIKAFGAILRRHRPAILHLHFARYIKAYPWLARISSIEKVFYTDHTSRPEGHLISPLPLWKRQLARALRWPLTSEVCVSDYIQKCILGRASCGPSE